jgi:2-polyprenyl-3-methyl-5-hydroxy-6-metoxy-1,4-benzoquinol methylase
MSTTLLNGFGMLNSHLINLFNPKWWSYLWRYQRGRTPWDTQITPPEVLAFIKTTPAGSALDIGCGTGTNAITMAKAGWRVTGIDFVPKAIRDARRKARQENLDIDFRVGDVTMKETLEGRFDYALDIGCLHSLPRERHRHYANAVAKVLPKGATFMLYAWLPRIWHGKPMGLAIEAVHAMFEPELQIRQTIVGEESGAPSAWYWFTKRTAL